MDLSEKPLEEISAAENSPDLGPLHVRWLTQIDALVASGVSLADAAEAMVTIAIVSKARAEGIRKTARQLFLLARWLSASADKQDAEVRH